MRVLLLSMPDSFEHTPSLTVRMPNGALTSIAGNADPHHDIAVADLVLVQKDVRRTVERLMRERDPEVVGLSVMTFQRHTARHLIRLVRAIKPSVRVVVGGYDASLAPSEYEQPDLGVDFLVRSEGDLTFRDLLRHLEQGGGVEGSRPIGAPDAGGAPDRSLDESTSGAAAIAGLSVHDGCRFRHGPARHVNALKDGAIALPRRDARVLEGYTFMGRQVDVVETSRGCTYDCSFCSIIEMRGRNFHTFDFTRVIADIRDARTRGARAIFIVDDNIMLNVARFEALCRAIIDAGLHDLHYIVQAMTSSIANHGDTVAPLMRAAGFRYVFLGIENVLEHDLAFLRAAAKNAQREHGRSVGNATVRAIDLLHQHGLYVVGGLIVGNPDDTSEAITANLEFARRYVDWPYIQHPTPYPGTPMTRDFQSRGLIVSERTEEYDGTTAVVRSEHLTAEEIEFMRWRDERWMKLRHLPAAIRHYPLFVLRHGPRMLAHTFRGSTWRSALGLEDARAVFRRYKSIRRAEREYLPPAGPATSPGPALALPTAPQA